MCAPYGLFARTHKTDHRLLTIRAKVESVILYHYSDCIDLFDVIHNKSLRSNLRLRVLIILIIVAVLDILRLVHIEYVLQLSANSDEAFDRYVTQISTL